jgi:hypothetical protein
MPQTPRWRTTVRSVEQPDPLAVGTRFAATTRLLGKTWDWVLEVSALELETRFAYRIVEGVAKMTVEYQFEATESGCRFTMSAESDGDGTLARMLKPIAARTLRRESERHVANLKRLLESPA